MNLLPCPLCGNDEIELNPVMVDGEPMFVVRCDCCSARIDPQAREMAVAIWNQRAPRPHEATEPYQVLEHPVIGRFQVIKVSEAGY
ncbi:Lar family restriction alleviation protein [Salmonella enterica]|nr:Lar family restriction alleviation protein [Salmonella enterica]